MANIVISTHWTDGDVIPFIRIGKALKQRGHRVILLTHCYYEKAAYDAGLEFAPWDTEEEYQKLINDMGQYTDTAASAEEIHLFREKYESLDVRLKEFEKISKYCLEENTIILAKNRSSISAFMASEKFKCPIVLFFMNPYEIASMVNFYSLFKERLNMEVNKLRECVELPPINSWLAWQSSIKMQLALWPKWFTTQIPEWPSEIITTGFPNEIVQDNGTREIPKEILKILEEDPNPVLITGGTSKQIKPDFYMTAIEACKILKKRTIVVTRYKEFLPKELPRYISWFKHLPLDDVMPYMGVVIHHGGIGTVSGAIYASVPQLAMAYHVDRPLNASKVKSLGLGEYLPPLYWQPKLIADTLIKLMQPNYKVKCANFLKDIPCNNTLMKICDVVESMGKNTSYALSHGDILYKEGLLKEQDIVINSTKANQNKNETKSKPINNLSPEIRRLLLEKKLSNIQKEGM